MTYRITIRKSALKVLAKISDPDYSRIKKTINALGSNPRPSGCKKLRGRNGFRIRQGDYRIIYEIADDILIVDVIAIGHRSEVYE